MKTGFLGIIPPTRATSFGLSQTPQTGLIVCFHSPLKGRGVQSGIRIVYAYHALTYTVDFIEIYFKGESENEDRERIREYLASV